MGHLPAGSISLPECPRVSAAADCSRWVAHCTTSSFRLRCIASQGICAAFFPILWHVAWCHPLALAAQCHGSPVLHFSEPSARCLLFSQAVTRFLFCTSTRTRVCRPSVFCRGLLVHVALLCIVFRQGIYLRLKMYHGLGPLILVIHQVVPGG